MSTEKSTTFSNFLNLAISNVLYSKFLTLTLPVNLRAYFDLFFEKIGASFDRS